MKKKLTYAGLVIGLSVMASMTAFAGEWKQDSKGWTYQNDDGTRYSNGWQWIDGNNDGVSECYYFNADGYCLLNTTTPDGYQVNSDGAWVENGVVQTRSNAEKTNGGILYKGGYLSVDYDPALDGMTCWKADTKIWKTDVGFAKQRLGDDIIYQELSWTSYPKIVEYTMELIDSHLGQSSTARGAANPQRHEYDINGLHWYTLEGNAKTTDGYPIQISNAITCDEERIYSIAYYAFEDYADALNIEQVLSKIHVIGENDIWSQIEGNIDSSSY